METKNAPAILRSPGRLNTNENLRNYIFAFWTPFFCISIPAC
jgi:hypothetical protein